MGTKAGRDDHKRQTAVEWAADTEVYLQGLMMITAGEYGVDTDAIKFKVADGFHTWADLPYFSPGAGGGGGAPTGAAGGDLTGTYPNPTIGANKVTTAKILDANVTLAKLADVATPSVLGRVTPGVGPVSALTSDEARLALEFPENIGTPGALLGANAGTTAYEERTPAQVRAAAAAAPQHYLNGAPQSGSTYTFTGTTDANGRLAVNLTTATPAMATAYLISAISLDDGSPLIPARLDDILTAYTVAFVDLTGTPAIGGLPVSFTVGGTLA